MGYLCFMVYGGVLVIVPNIASYLMYVHRTYGPNQNYSNHGSGSRIWSWDALLLVEWLVFYSIYGLG